METLRSVAMWVVIGAPIIGVLLACLSQRFVGSLIGVRLLAAAALVSALALLADVVQTGQPVERHFGTWLELQTLTISFAAHGDGLALLQVAWTSAVLLVVLSNWPSQVSQRWLMLAWLGVTTVATAGNLGQMFFGWCLSAWASSELARRPDPLSAASPLFRPVWLVQRLSDAMLLTGIGLVWMSFGSLEWSAWTTEAIARQRTDLLSSIALTVLIGVIGRCAQLPLSVWLEAETGFAAKSNHSMAKLSNEMVGLWNVPDGHHVAERLNADPASRWQNEEADAISASAMAWWLCAAFLPVGICVLIRFEPLLAVASNTKLLAVAVGAFTLMLCSASAAAQNSWARVLGQLAAGQCGLALVSMSLEHSSGANLSLFMLLWQSLLFAVLLTASVTAERNRGGGLLAVAALLLISGFWGRHAVTDAVWQEAFPAVAAATTDAGEDSVVLGKTSSSVLPFVVGLVCLSELLLSFALFRAFFLSGRQEITSGSLDHSMREVASHSATDASLWLAIIGIVIVGVWLGWDADLWNKVLNAGATPSNSADDTAQRVALGAGHLMPLSAIGVVLAWWMYSKKSSLPEKISATMGPFARLSRNRFYWNDLYFLLVAQPANSVGRRLAWFDEQVWERGRQAARRGIARFAAESCEPLANGAWPIYALTSFGSAVVLAWMLMWLKSSP